ncbi:MAG: ChbG/HpnK family deacetylase [Christensenellales bacterium]|jgi:predicted glycoside hydrolase/deacetylase ChbG (UPF0249 family)
MDKSAKEKYLIIGADDFGICPSVNKAIIQLLEQGKITSVNIIAQADCADEAIAYVVERGLSAGAHLTLNSDQKQHPWKAISKAESICDKDGFLYYDTGDFARLAKSKDVTRECRAQIEALIAKGVSLDHIDSHSGTLYGINKRLFFINAFRLCREYNLPFRFPVQAGFLDDYFAGGAPFIVKAAFKAVAALAGAMRVKLIDNMVTNPYPVNKIQNYSALEEYYIKAIKNLPYGVSEMFLHPAYYCPVFSPLTEEWKKREWELEFLLSNALENTIKNEGIKLISYKDLYALKAQ